MHHHRRFFLPLFLLGLGLLAVVPLREQLTAQAIAVRSPGGTAAAAAFLVLLYGLKSLSVAFPMSALTAAGGLLFPFPTALAVNLVGVAAAQTLPWLVGRRSQGDLRQAAARWPFLARRTAAAGGPFSCCGWQAPVPGTW